MGASEKAVAAVMETLEHHGRYMEIPNGHVSCHCGETGWVTKGEYRKHVAVAAADAAVDTDRPSTQAQALLLAAKDLQDGRGPEDSPHVLLYDFRVWLRARAHRVKAQP